MTDLTEIKKALADGTFYRTIHPWDITKLVERCERAEAALRGLLDWAERGDENATPANWTRFSEAVTRARAVLTATEQQP